MLHRLRSPGWHLFQAAILMLLLAALVTWLTVRQPWLGLSLEADPDHDRLLLLAEPGQKNGAAYPRVLVAFEKEGLPPFPLHAVDLIEEPDTLPGYADIRAFLARQASLQRYLDGQPVTLVTANPDSDTILQDNQHRQTLVPQAYRPLSSLPLAFWIQLAAGAGGFLIGLWVMVLRPREWSARCFALTGVGLMLSAFAAAIYSVRELVVPAELFQVLGALNHTGAFLFGCALMALFLLFPSRLVRPRNLLLIPAVFLPWLVLDTLYAAPSPALGMYLPVLLQTVSVLVFILLQWRHNRGNPLDMAALRWLGLSSLLTASLFIGVAAAPALLGRPAIMSQGHAFGLFLILYAGLALGLRRYRLFDLDRWAFHLLLWVTGATTLLLLDMAMVALLHLNHGLSLTLSLLVCGFLWLPFRSWLWQRIVDRQPRNPHEDFRRILQVALAPGDAERRQRWEQFLQDRFSPLHVQTAGHDAKQDTNHATIALNGLEMTLPAVGKLPALALGHAHQGRRLFTPRDTAYIDDVIGMLRYASDSRDAYNQGVREERSRIARDLHDDIGSRLLTGLHQPGIEATRRSIQQAITEMRTIINGLTGTEMLLEVLVAELRHETALRLEAAGISLDWPLPDNTDDDKEVMLGYRIYRNYLSVMRELVSNILRHANATQVRITLDYRDGQLVTQVTDNGVGLPADEAGAERQRYGLTNLRGRMTDLGGSIAFTPADVTGGTCVTLTLPLDASVPVREAS